jgi:hypothetical protein
LEGADGFRALLDRENLFRFEATYSSVAEAKTVRKVAVAHQQRLRYVKRLINQEMKEIRAQYAALSGKAGSGGSAVLSLFGKRKMAGQWRAAAKADSRSERDAVLRDYEDLKLMIDDSISQLDVAKARLSAYR